MKARIIIWFKRVNPEALVWITGLTALAFINLENTSHFTICPLNNLGLDYCPGCGLGKSISYLFSLKIEQSFAAHPLGIFAFIILLHRIFFLMLKSYKINKPSTHYLTNQKVK